VSENVVIPAYMLDSARAQGLTQIYYSRTFTARDLASNVLAVLKAQIVFNIGGTAGGTLWISRLALSFEAGDVNRVIGSGSRLQARVAVDTQGSGLLRAVWEVAEPPSTQGEPVYRLLQSIQQLFTGNQSVTLRSPLLPSGDNGSYLVRLRVLQPETLLTQPEISYVVIDSGASKMTTLQALAPTGLTRIGPQTRFEWRAVPGAEHYRIEIYTQELRTQINTIDTTGKQDVETSELVPGHRVTGIVVPGSQLSTKLAALTRQHLQSGLHYFWQIQALDANGRVFATSDRGEIIGE